MAESDPTYRITVHGPPIDIEAVVAELRQELGPDAVTLVPEAGGFLSQRQYGHVEAWQIVIDLLIAVGAPSVSDVIKRVLSRHERVSHDPSQEERDNDGPVGDG